MKIFINIGVISTLFLLSLFSIATHASSLHSQPCSDLTTCDVCNAMKECGWCVTDENADEEASCQDYYSCSDSVPMPPCETDEENLEPTDDNDNEEPSDNDEEGGEEEPSEEEGQGGEGEPQQEGDETTGGEGAEEVGQGQGQGDAQQQPVSGEEDLKPKDIEQQPQAAAGFEDYVSSLQVIPGELTLYWKPSPSDTTSLSFALRCKCSGWFSIAWSPAGKMTDSDAVVGTVNSDGTAKVTTYKLQTAAAPSLANPSLVLSETSGSVSDGISTIKFTRKISAGSLSLDKPRLVIGAYHPDSTDLEYHMEHHTDDAVQVDFLADNSNSPSGTTSAGKSKISLRDIHGILMMTAWGLITFGVLFARYTRWIPNAVWFHVHKIAQFIGFLISVGSGILGLTMTHAHFSIGYHGALGIVILTLSTVQVLFAFFRPHPPQKNEVKSSARKTFEVCHWWLGRFLIIMAIVQIYSGIKIIGYNVIIYAIVVAVVVGIVIIGEIVGCVNPKAAVVPCFGNLIECQAKPPSKA